LVRRGFLMIWLVLCAPVFPVLAQNQFSPAIQVGDAAITYYQINQRGRFLTLLGAPGDARALASDQLINEAVQMNAVRAEGSEPTAEEVEAAMAEFAGRANLTTEKFLDALLQAGVQPQTYRDFITAGVAWRSYVRGNFVNSTRASIKPDQIGRSLAQTGTDGGLRVLVSEILLPSTTPETARASRARAAELSRLTDEPAFAAAARQFSVAPSATRGGEQNWVALETIPEEIRGIIAALSPGQVSRPVELGNTIGVFLLRDEERVEAGTADDLLVDYALFVAGPSKAEAQAVADKIDTCDDLYGEAYGLPENRLIRDVQPVSALPADIRAVIDDLDTNEATTSVSRGGNATVVMLCERKPGLESTVDFDIVGNRLLNLRMSNMAENRLAELRAATTIIDHTK